MSVSHALKLPRKVLKHLSEKVTSPRPGAASGQVKGGGRTAVKLLIDDQNGVLR